VAHFFDISANIFQKTSAGALKGLVSGFKGPDISRKGGRAPFLI
jgi:hypothetical protein